MIRAWFGWFRGRKLVGDNRSPGGWGVTAPPEGQVGKEMWTSIYGTGMGKGEARVRGMEVCLEDGTDPGVSKDIER